MKNVNVIKSVPNVSIKHAKVQMTLIIEESYFEEFKRKVGSKPFYYSQYHGIITRNANTKITGKTKVCCVTITGTIACFERFVSTKSKHFKNVNGVLMIENRKLKKEYQEIVNVIKEKYEGSDADYKNDSNYRMIASDESYFEEPTYEPAMISVTIMKKGEPFYEGPLGKLDKRSYNIHITYLLTRSELRINNEITFYRTFFYVTAKSQDDTEKNFIYTVSMGLKEECEKRLKAINVQFVVNGKRRWYRQHRQRAIDLAEIIKKCDDTKREDSLKKKEAINERNEIVACLGGEQSIKNSFEIENLCKNITQKIIDDEIETAERIIRGEIEEVYVNEDAEIEPYEDEEITRIVMEMLDKLN